MLNYSGSDVTIDVYYREQGSRFEKELVWAGDGIQIWLQILLHVYRNFESSTLVFDEPEVFLHADLQRRLVRLIDNLSSQVLLASHSSEILAETDTRAIIWIDKNQKKGIRTPTDDVLSDLTASLGTAYNLSLARALRAQAVLFVEGNDSRILRILSRKMQHVNLERETSLAVIPMGGYSNWPNTEHFKWLIDDFLQRSIKSMILLDRDYRTDDQVSSTSEQLNQIFDSVHIWHCKEIENYLIIPEVISRVSGADFDDIREYIDSESEGMKSRVFARMLEQKTLNEKSASNHAVSISEEFHRSFPHAWSDPTYRVSVCPPKDLLSGINKHLQSNRKKTVSFEKIAHNIRAKEIPLEMRNVLQQIEDLS
ncbi:putative ATP-dependent endonuclease of OLD family [Streptomonospora salina]|uniref:Putative ATP-dependent endonuclease of OLD family n=1 Tax=Streptomonospora salina TaxID=104205 RepID=A0A841E706_9ACTN|nr:putative ATP-dependent endonuclease of OLD family [Streptomonospora salina]